MLAFASAASAQTADQIRQYKQLTPEQREQLSEALDKSKASRADSKPLDQPEVVTPAPPRDQPAGPTEPSTIEQRYAGRTDAASLGQTPSVRAITQQLKQFGYDLFAGAPTTFAPATDIPVPADYVIGPGDVIEVQLFGKDNEQYSLVVSRDGRINFPEIGAIPVTGLKFTELRQDLERRVAEQMIGVKASVTMGALRSIRVFVLGDVTRAGSFTVSALSTMTNALFVSGGIRPIGSLRNVQLKRNGRLVTRLDLYDLLLRGDTSDDVRLQPGDVIFVPPIGQTAAAAGEVRRPAIYELRGEKTVRQLVEIAGGLLPTAVPRLSQLERLDARGNVTLVDLDLGTDPLSREAGEADSPLSRGAGEGAARSAAGEGGGSNTTLKDGDVLRIYPNLDRMEGIVLLAGHVKRPGGIAWRERMRLSDLIPNADHLLSQADLDYVVVRREERPLAKISVFSTRLSAAWSDPQSDANVLLEPRDQVFVFPSSVMPAQAGIQRLSVGMHADISGGAEAAVIPPEGAVTPTGYAVTPAQAGVQSLPSTRQSLLKPLLDELISQSSSTEPTRIVSVGGLVREPGNYPLEPGMRVADLIRAGGGLGEAAYTLGAEITRYAVATGEKREINHITVDLAQVLQGDASANVALQAHDKLTIKRLPEWAEQLVAEVRGEVRFPGSYPIKRGERLSDLLARAGGLTDQAFPEGSVFTRDELRLKEQERIDTLARQLEADIAAASLQKAQEDTKQAEALATARALLPQLRTARATGRLVIDLPELLEKGRESEYDVVLKAGDALIIPAKTQEVTVIGEVQYPTSHLVESGLESGDYIERSGGLTFKADDDRIYVVRANGMVEPANPGWWIFRTEAEVKPGDTIVIPLDVERMRPLTFWSSVSQIIYQIAVSVAVLNTIGAI
jgi:protein involved in polysaccharide export with SLBB domain